MDLALKEYVQDTSAQMLEEHKLQVGVANGAVYLVATHWDSCDPLQKAEGVVQAKEYTDVRSYSLVAYLGP